MAQICRVLRSNGYTVMANHHLDNHALSLKAKGLLSLMLRLPEDWDYTVEGLATLCKDGRDSINTALGELERFGYVTRYQTHAAGGEFSGNEYIIREAPEQQETAPFTENPSTVLPFTENPQTVVKNNNLNLNQVLNNQPPLPPTGEQGLKPKKQRTKKQARKAPDWEPEMFERFWKAYPRGEDKQAAMDEWDKLQPTMVLMKIMSDALKAQKETKDWKKGVGIPYACRWLKNRRWEDDLKEAAGQDVDDEELTDGGPEVSDTW